MDDKYLDLWKSDESDEPEEPIKYESPARVFSKFFSDDYLKRQYQIVKRELESGKIQMDTKHWYSGKRKVPLHEEPITPADIIKEYKRRAEKKSEGLLEY